MVTFLGYTMLAFLNLTVPVADSAPSEAVIVRVTPFPLCPGAFPTRYLFCCYEIPTDAKYPAGDSEIEKVRSFPSAS